MFHEPVCGTVHFILFLFALLGSTLTPASHSANSRRRPETACFWRSIGLRQEALARKRDFLARQKE
jgi:hypothetical protein